MAAIEVGRVCVKKAGRDAAEKCVITKVIDENFVEIVSQTRRKNPRKCAIRHLEPTEALIDPGNETEISEALK